MHVEDNRTELWIRVHHLRHSLAVIVQTEPLRLKVSYTDKLSQLMRKSERFQD